LRAVGDSKVHQSAAALCVHAPALPAFLWRVHPEGVRDLSVRLKLDAFHARFTESLERFPRYAEVAMR
jgi:hypothetical protein